MGSESFGSFLKENKDILKNYVDVRLRIFRLQGIKIASKSVGYLIFALVAMFLVFLIFLFAGLVLGFYLSALCKSNAIGFGITTLIWILVFLLIVALRNKLFINPIIKAIIKNTNEEELEEEDEY